MTVYSKFQLRDSALSCHAAFDHKMKFHAHTVNILSPCQVSFNPHNNMQLCVSGAGVLKLFHYSEGALKQSSAAKMDSVNFLCHAWTSEERVIAGTDTGRLLVSESGDLRREIRITSPVVEGHADRSGSGREAFHLFTYNDLAICSTVTQ